MSIPEPGRRSRRGPREARRCTLQGPGYRGPHRQIIEDTYGYFDVYLGPRQRRSHVEVDLPNVFALKPGIKGGHLVDRCHLDDFAVHQAVSRGNGVWRFPGEQAPRGPIADVALAPRGAQQVHLGPPARRRGLQLSDRRIEPLESAGHSRVPWCP